MKNNKEVQVCEVIISKQLLRGNGDTELYRRVLQVFTKDGDLIAENDSLTFNNSDLLNFGRFITGNDKLTMYDVNKWIKTTSNDR